MGVTGNSLFPHLTTQQASPRTTGILPAQTIRELIAGGRIEAIEEITEEQIQPASIDLRLGEVAYRVRASSLAGQERTVEEKVSELPAGSCRICADEGLRVSRIDGNGRS